MQLGTAELMSPAAMADSPLSPWPSVTVIVAVRNGESSIARCLHAVLAQDYPGPSPEVIAVDNGSTDGTLVVLNQFAPRVTTILEPRRGVSWARNAAIMTACGEWLAFTDADCVPQPRWLFELVDMARANREASFVGGRIIALPGSNSIALFSEALFDQRRSILEERPPSFISANLLACRAAILRFGMFNAAYLRGQDTELAWRSCSRHSARFVYAEAAIVEHKNPSTLLGLLRKAIQHGRGSAMLWRDFTDDHGLSIPRRLRQFKPFKDALRETVVLLVVSRHASDGSHTGPRRLDAFYFAIFRLFRHLSFIHRTLLPEVDP